MKFKRNGVVSRALGLIALGLSVGLPLWAERPPAGTARPPIHVRGNATTSPTGLSPSRTRVAYGFNLISNQGAGQVVGIVDAFDDPNIESDLGVFDTTFGLPSCTTANGCFEKIFASGSKPRTNSGWALEISLDVEWAHAIAPAAKIILVEAASNSFTDLLTAVDVAVKNGASVISMSWGGSEFSSETGFDSHFNVTTACFTASSGDSGNGVEYPAASPYVVGVGGTTLNLNSDGTYGSESAWSGSGGGQSAVEAEPSYQSSLPIPDDPNSVRGVPDVAYDADPNTGFSIYDTVKYQGQSGWFQVGGTSAGAPQWAALIAIADSSRVAVGKGVLTSASFNAASDLYTLFSTSSASDYHDITSGSNGACGTLCTATAGYDYVTGLGTPQANNLVTALVNLP